MMLCMASMLASCASTTPLGQVTIPDLPPSLTEDTRRHSAIYRRRRRRPQRHQLLRLARTCSWVEGILRTAKKGDEVVAREWREKSREFLRVRFFSSLILGLLF
jgi:hypothetical protein